MTADSVLSNLTLTGATLRYNSPDDLTDPDAFVPKTLTVAGDYTGNGGHVILNTVLNDDNSLADTVSGYTVLTMLMRRIKPACMLTAGYNITGLKTGLKDGDWQKKNITLTVSHFLPKPGTAS